MPRVYTDAHARYYTLMRNALLALVAISLAALALFVIMRPSEEIPNDTPSAFEETGNLIQQPELEPGSWFLSHEKPGQPGLLAKLLFDAQSVCEGIALETPCNSTQLEAGMRVTITGLWQGDAVRVTSLSLSPDAGRTVKLYFYNPKLDQGEGGAQCSEKGLVALERVIPRTISPIQDVIKILIRGEISEEEQAQGIETEFPLEGVELLGASLSNGTLTLTFADPLNATSGGACRVSVLAKQIEATAKQFPEVERVILKPDEAFQP